MMDIRNLQFDCYLQSCNIDCRWLLRIIERKETDIINTERKIAPGKFNIYYYYSGREKVLKKQKCSVRENGFFFFFWLGEGPG